jgi:hypothetical protein
MDLQSLMSMTGRGNAPDVGSRQAPLNAPPASANQQAMLQMLLQLIMQQLGQGMPMQQGMAQQGVAPQPVAYNDAQDQPVM